MSKNVTRKGIALGALVALGSTLFASAPAHAAAALTIAPKAGTTYNVISSDDFELKAYGNVDLPDAQLAKLKWKVTNADSATLTYTTSDGASGGTTETVDGTAGTASSGTSDIVGANYGTGTELEYLGIDPTTDATTTAVTLTVQAFIDSDLGGDLDADEVASAAVTVKFISGSSITATTVLTAPQIGVNPEATVTYNNDINLEQTTLTNVGVQFLSNGSETTAKGSSTKALNDAKTAVVFTGGTAAGAGATIGARPYVDKSDADTLGAEGTAVYSTVSAAGSATGASLTFDNGANIRTATGTYDINSASSGSSTAVAGANKVIRKGTKSVSFGVQFLKTNADTNVGAGQTVKVVLSEPLNTTNAAYDIPASSEIVSGGKTLKSASAGGAAESVTYFTTTGADGKVTITLDSKLAAAGESVQVMVYSGASYSVAVGVNVLWKDATADRIVETTSRLTNDTRRILKGGSVSVNYQLLDQFGVKFAAADTFYRVKLTPGSVSSGASFTNLVTLTGGEGSATVTDNSTAADDWTLDGALESSTASVTWAALSVSNIWTTAAAGNGTTTTNVSVVDALDTPATITLDDVQLSDNSTAPATTGVPLADKALAAKDLRFNKSSVVAPGYGSNKGANLSGTVTTSNGANANGVAVTISAAKVGFGTDAGDVFTLDSITVYTGSNGQYSVDAFSKTAGAVVFTIKSGDITKTQTVTFAKPAEADADSVTVTAVKTTKAGRAIDVTVKVLDANGNGIDTDGSGDTLDITVSGAGYTYSVPTSTNASGVATFKLIFGLEDKGVATISASFDADGASTTYSAKTASTEVLAGITASIAKPKKGANVVVKYASGATIKVVRGTKSVTKVATSDSQKVALKTGTGTVTVYVNGIKVASK
jgi:hypothetical protein